MSTLRLTITYTHKLFSGEVSAFSNRAVLAYPRKKFLVNLSAPVLIVLVSFYMFLVGSSAAGELAASEAGKALELERSLLTEAQEISVAKDGLVQDYISSQSYKNANSFEVLRRTSNVAEKGTAVFFR